MKIHPLAYSPARNYQRTNVKNNSREMTMTTAASPSFKGLKAGFFSALGAAAGCALGTVLSGGLLAPILLSGAGCVAGGIYGQKDEPTDEYYDPEYPSGFECIG